MISKIVVLCFVHLSSAQAQPSDGQTEQPASTTTQTENSSAEAQAPSSTRIRRIPPALSTKELQMKALDEALMILDYQYDLDLQHKVEHFDVTTEELREKYGRMIEEALTVDEANKLVNRVQREVLSPEQARYVLVALVSEVHDGHVSNTTRATGASAVGIMTVALDGRLYVAGVNKNRMQIVNEVAAIQPTDEIIAVDGRDIAFYKNRNLNYVNNGTIEARKDEALERILEVPTALLPSTPRKGDEVKITFRRGESTFTNSYRWFDIDAIDLTRPVSPSQAKRRHEPYIKDAPLIFGAKGTVRSYFYEGLLNFIQAMEAQNKPAPEIVDVGAQLNFYRSAAIKKSASEFSMSGIEQQLQQPLSKQEIESFVQNISLMGPVERIPIYLIQGLEKPIPVIRIPSYSPPGGILEVIKEIQFIAQAINYFNTLEGVDTLIIDQLSNPGGYTAYAHMLLSLLTPADQPMKGLQAELLLNETLFTSYLEDSQLSDNMIRILEKVLKQDASEIRRQLPFLVSSEESTGTQSDQNTLDGEPSEEDIKRRAIEEAQRRRAAEERRRSILEELRRQLDSGQRASSRLAYGLDGSIDLDRTQSIITANKGVSWGKKIVILADERCASCGEIVPAILQDNSRFRNQQTNEESIRTLFVGTRTMGLGNPLNGHLKGLNFSEMDMRCPYAFCWRPNGSYIENLGVSADVVHPATLNDWQGGFSSYSINVVLTTLGFSNGVAPSELQVKLNNNKLQLDVTLSNLKIAENSQNQPAVANVTDSIDNNAGTPNQQNTLVTATSTQNLQAYHSGEFLHPNPKVSSLLLKLQSDLSRIPDDVETHSNDYILIYKEFFDALYEIEQSGALSQFDWSRLQVPLPKSLTDSDPILSVTTRKDAVLRRFEELFDHRKYKDKPLTVALMRALFRESYRIRGYFHYNTPCHLILR